MNPFLAAALFIILAPVVGVLITGLDRILTARMQGRVGPPVLQPWYDIRKLFQKKQVAVWGAQSFFIFCYLIFIIFTGALFFAGGDILLVIFAFTLGHVFLVLGAYVSYSPYAHIGAERELIQLMAVEPMIIIVAIGLYQVNDSFLVGDMINHPGLPILLLPGVFLGFIYILTFKLRKSPFDLATSHHAHQELVKGSTTEFSGFTLGMIELAHIYELVVMLGFIWLFFGNNLFLSAVAIVVIMVLEILVDNCTSRVRWQDAITSAWFVTLVAGAGNIFALSIM
ncbi:MAG: NADH-quinone oxidoreductase subunit H [Methanomicrobiales archaeon]|nr:NADH-quinone oxidoreductase subunit H [Methanomicrobiales archaeon]